MKAAKHGFRLTLGILMIAMLVMGSLGFSAYAAELVPASDDTNAVRAEEAPAPDAGASVPEEESPQGDDDSLTDGEQPPLRSFAANQARSASLMALPNGLLTATSPVTTWAELQEAISYGGTINLTANVTAGQSDEPLEIPYGQRVTLNLNGHTIKRDNINNEVVKSLETIHVYGTLTLMDSAGGGKIVGGYGYYQSGQKSVVKGVVNEGGFTMQSGTIDTIGASIDNAGTLTVSGGTISGDIESNNSNSVFNLSGSPTISGRVYRDDDGNPINITGMLGTNLRVPIYYSGRIDKPLVVTNGLKGRGTLDNFVSAHSDTSGVTLNEAGEVILQQMVSVEFRLNKGDAEAWMTIRVMRHNKVTRPEDPVQDDMVFDEWLTKDGTIWDFENDCPGDSDYYLDLYGSWLTPWGELQKEINKGGIVKLTEDVTARSEDDPLTIPEGVEVTLDLAGHTLCRGSESTTTGSMEAVHIYGTLNLIDSANGGKITGGVAVGKTSQLSTLYIGSVVINEGVFEMSGGQISYASASADGTMNSESSAVNNKGVFKMSGGTIQAEYEYHGSVSNEGTGAFTMSGGTLSGAMSNTGTFNLSGGTLDKVANTGIFNLSGGPQISDRIILDNNSSINIIGDLAKGACFPVAGNTNDRIPKVVTSSLGTHGGLDNFKSYTPALGIGLNYDGEVYLDYMRTVEFRKKADDENPYYTTKVFNGDKVERQVDPIQADWVFNKWYNQKDGTEYNFDTPVTEDTHLYGTWLSRWGGLKREFEKGGEIKLLTNYKALEGDDALVVPAGKTVTLDLAGCTLNRNVTEVSANKTPAIIVYGKLILNDSKGDGQIIGGGNENPGGGVRVEAGGTFTMNAGTITGCTAKQNGGGVYVEEGGTFTMTGGTISGNTAKDGKGNAVYNNGTFTVSGAPVIDGGDSSVYLPKDKVITIGGKLGTSVKIGVMMQKTGVFTSGLKGNGTKDNFKNQNSDYPVRINDNGEAYLMPSIKVTIDPGNGYTPETKLVDGGEPIEKPPVDPVWDNHIFQGWYVGDELFDFATAINKDVMISGQWLVTWEDLQKKIDNAKNGDTITLTQDVIAENWLSALHVDQDKKVTIDLNGHSIDRARTTPVKDGYVIKVEGELTIKDRQGTGKITGGNNTESGGGVYVNSGKFTLEGGAITGNSAGEVGGVNVTGGEFVMTGGTITGNSATTGITVGAAIASTASFTMTGGSITQDTSDVCYGVNLNNSAFTISGNPVIHVGKGYGLNVVTNNDTDWRINVNGPLSSNARIEAYIDRQGVFTYGLKGNGTEANFVNQNEGLMMGINDNGEAYLAVPVTVTFDSDGGSEVEAQKLLPDKTAKEPETPTKNGFVFMGWQLNDAVYDFATPVTADITLKAKWLTPWAALQYRIDNATTGATVTLDQNVTAGADEQAITVPTGKTVTIDLNGHTINRGLTAAKADGQVITVQGRLTVTGSGTITGGWTTTAGGGVYVESGAFTLAGGTISGNKANYGGGVALGGGTFNMNGGAISGNEGATGGGVYLNNYGKATLTGGSITGNTATSNGGGVYSGGSTLSLSGAPVIQDNKDANGKANNLLSESDVNIAGALSGNAKIGVTKATPGVFTKNLSGKGTAANFTSDNSAYIVGINASGEALLGAPVTVTFDSDDGSAVEAQQVASGAKATKPDDPTKEGCAFQGWYQVTVTDPETLADDAFDFGTTISENITLKAQYTQKTSISYTVTFKVVNGSWNEGEGDAATADKTVPLTGYEGDTLKLAATDIPAVGSKPNDTYKAGSWDTVPSADTAITAATTYTYTYAAKEAAVVTKAPEGKKLTYNGQAQDLVTKGEAEGGEMYYALGMDANTPPSGMGNDTSVPKATEAGTYYVWYKVVGDENHNDTEVQGPIVVKIANANVAPTVPTASIGSGLVYNGQAQALLTKGSVEGGTLYYGVSTDPNTPPTAWSEDVPTATAAGTYYAWYKVEPDANHNGVAPTCLMVNIAKKPLTVTAEAKSKVEGEADPALTYIADDLIGSDQLSGALSREAGEAAGIYAIQQGSLTAGANYELTYTGAYLTITAKPEETKPQPAPVQPQPQPEPAPAPVPVDPREVLITTSTSTGDFSFNTTWNAVRGADGYDVFFTTCGDYSFKHVATVPAGQPLSYDFAGLNKYHGYKVIIKAWQGASGNYIKESPVAHCYTGGGTAKLSNPGSLTLKKTALTIKLGKSASVGATVKGVKKGKVIAHDGKVRYLSSDPSVVTISRGKMKAVGAGACTVYVLTTNGIYKPVAVTVDANPTSVKLSKPTRGMKIGQTQALGAKVVLKPKGAVTTLTWVSSKPEIVSVDAYGNVTALSKGRATITVTTANGKKTKLNIRVK